MLNVKRLCVGDFQMNCYIVSDPLSGEAMVTDPGADAEGIARALEGLKPVGVLLTHAHFDHMGAADELCARFGVPLYVHEADADKLRDPKGNQSATFGEWLVVSTPPVTLADGQTLKIGKESLTVMHTPGHSAGSCCFLLPDGAGVLCGDTLFNGGYGRTDFADGDMGQMKNSLRALMRLTPAMPAYPGHGAFTTAGRGGAEA